MEHSELLCEIGSREQDGVSSRACGTRWKDTTLSVLSQNIFKALCPPQAVALAAKVVSSVCTQPILSWRVMQDLLCDCGSFPFAGLQLGA